MEIVWYLLARVWGKVEHEHSEEGDAHAGDDQVHCVEQSLPPHGDVEGDVQVGLVTARVELHIPGEAELLVVNIVILQSSQWWGESEGCRYRYYAI